ncbi:hypothetical protein Cgig2_025375 [Carnegiea gigantea]|uniref:Uncharacterized protein n=1 Tax=Carnegiea gigantea TaxID=171969 RepID=A0A9Q1JHC4_9CARY|nr:hypothetical protein Cgig2_025375 [Carnegiea gigantea]
MEVTVLRSRFIAKWNCTCQSFNGKIDAWVGQQVPENWRNSQFFPILALGVNHFTALILVKRGVRDAGCTALLTCDTQKFHTSSALAVSMGSPSGFSNGASSPTCGASRFVASAASVSSALEDPSVTGTSFLTVPTLVYLPMNLYSQSCKASSSNGPRPEISEVKSCSSNDILARALLASLPTNNA